MAPQPRRGSSARASGLKHISWVEFLERGFPRNWGKVLFQSLKGDQVVLLFFKVLLKGTPNDEGL
jgi:hypothetical protein